MRMTRPSQLRYWGGLAPWKISAAAGRSESRRSIGARANVRELAQLILRASELIEQTGVEATEQILEHGKRLLIGPLLGALRPQVTALRIRPDSRYVPGAMRSL